MSEKPDSNIAAAYCFVVPHAQALARKLGYAIAVHGSMNRDLDLIAAPWTDDAVSAEELYNAFVEKFSPYLYIEGYKENHKQPTAKSHGRVAWSIMMYAGCQIDLSVMPRLDK